MLRQPIDFIDLHCDTITLCASKDAELRHNNMHIALDRVTPGSKWGQMFAIFMPDNLRGEDAVRFYDRSLAFYRQQIAKNSQWIESVTNARQLHETFSRGKFAAILTVEGASVLAGKIERVDQLYRDGVKVMTLTWNGANELASGNNTQQGFSSFGREAVKRMEERSIVVDVSHLNDTGFWELCEFADRPFIATHSNSREICGHPRNLTDQQFMEICRRGGLVGINYYKAFITDSGNTDTPNDLIRHILHFLELGGEDVIALGSDFDGADLPDYLKGVENMENFRESLIQAGISDKITQKIFFDNAVRFMEENF